MDTSSLFVRRLLLSPSLPPSLATRLLQGLVWSTWAVIACLLGLLVITYNLFPEFDRPE